jgi:hypothetical protein
MKNFELSLSTHGNYKKDEGKIWANPLGNIRATLPSPYSKGMTSRAPTTATVIAVVNPTISVETLPARLAHRTFGKGHLQHGRHDSVWEREKENEVPKGRAEEKGYTREKGRDDLTKETLVPVLLRPAWTRLLLPVSAITGQGEMGTASTDLIATSNMRDLREVENEKTLSLLFLLLEILRRRERRLSHY